MGGPASTESPKIVLEWRTITNASEDSTSGEEPPAKKAKVENDFGPLHGGKFSDAVVVGGSPLGGLYTPITDEEAVAICQAAYDSGVRRFDTAPHYGKGNAERRLGLFLKTLTDEQLAGVEVYTKVGRRLIPYEDLEAELMKPEVLGEEKEDGLFHGVGNVARVIDYSIKGIQRCVDESLERLNLPVSSPKCRLGIRLHDVDSPERWAEAQKEALQGMQSVRERGQVHEISLGLNEPEYINKFLNTKNHSLNSILSAGNWNLLDQSGAENFARCAKEGVEIHNAAVFAGGFLFGGKAWKFDEKDREKIEKVEGWRELCKEFSIDMGKAVMSFAFLPKVVTRMVVGVGSEKQVQDLLNNCSGEPIPTKFWLTAQERGLIRKDIDMSALAA